MLQPKRTKRTNKDKNKMKPDDILFIYKSNSTHNITFTINDSPEII